MAKKDKLHIKVIIGIVILSGACVMILYAWRQPIKILSPEQYGMVRDRLVEMVTTQDPRKALDELTRLTQSDEAVLRSCHGLVHEIGDAAFERYHDVGQALTYRDEICGSGYLHGVIETYLASSTDIQAALRVVCSGYADRLERASCYHGVGHGLMFYSNNFVPGSLMQCDAYPESESRVRCAEGVFMENFNTDQKYHPSDYLDTTDPLSLCRSQSQKYQRAVCTFYAPLFYLSIHVGKYDQAFSWCKDSAGDFVDSCIKGTASRITKENINRIPYVEGLCAKLEIRYQTQCASGIGSYHLTHYADSTKTESMCLTLRKDFQYPCLQATR